MKTLILASIIFSFNAKALDLETRKAVSKAAIKYNVSELELLKIAFVESTLRKSPPMRHNKNGTYDIGMFQINSIHWYATCKEIDVSKLNGNAMCAAKLLSQIKQHSKNDANWLARYHSKTPKFKMRYMKKLQQAETHIFTIAPDLSVASN